VSGLADHPALAPNAQGKVCTDLRCGTLLAPDAEVCDECGGIRFAELQSIAVLLCGWANDRPVVFGLPSDRQAIIGRSVPGGPTPDIDLRRFPGSGAIHRRHAWIELEDGEWRVTHLGTNALVVQGSESVVLEPGGTAKLRSGDTLGVGGVALQFVVRPSARRI
jgi:ribosomal protein L40E